MIWQMAGRAGPGERQYSLQIRVTGGVRHCTETEKTYMAWSIRCLGLSCRRQPGRQPGRQQE
ncbi:hypothetical protein HOE425_331984 [Hoeflea sp. EC-HK425]|nr:hypothetical protein HOE425_331984 [Hoeflea sp. EC-HK425]